MNHNHHSRNPPTHNSLQVVLLVPFIIIERADVLPERIQMWTSVLIAAYGGAFVALSPLLPFLTPPRGPMLWSILFVGLACAAGSFALMQLSSSILLLILARVIHGVGSVATTGACSGMLSAAAGSSGTDFLAWMTPAFIQSMAMSAAPTIAGLLYDYAGGETAVFYCAYAMIGLTALLALFVVIATPEAQVSTTRDDDMTDRLLSFEGENRNYGTIGGNGTQADFTLRGGGSGEDSARSRLSGSSLRSSRSSRRGSTASSVTAFHEILTPASSPRTFVAMYGYVVVGLLTTALHSVLPLFVERTFKWPMSANGFVFVVLSAPAALISPLAGALTDRAPKVARFLTAFGFLACLPAFIYLGSLNENTPPVYTAFLATLAVISFATGLCAEPLNRVIVQAVTRAEQASFENAYLPSPTAQASSLPNVAWAWGILIGPLLAGVVSSGWGWQNMATALGSVGAFTSLIMLLYLQGWIGNLYSQSGGRNAAPTRDEETAPLLHRLFEHSGDSYTYQRPSMLSDDENGRDLPKGGFFERTAPFISTDESEDFVPKKFRHRRHFSVDNFSAGSVSSDPETSQIRFQAALETPLSTSITVSQQTGDSAKNAQRRFLMREAPHAPATDPLLAEGNRYVIDEELSTVPEGEELPKRHVVVFEEGNVPPGLLKRGQHHTVTINSVDGSAKLVLNPESESHAVHVTEETGEEPEFSSASRRYVVILLNEGETGFETGGDEST
ncbi:major facilitator superfamily domain-containing protein [Bombardia bombarda]|uniref:Major facilitator superfamily domain-containing protein n=1 Tax=Bombardia bombarda TaxID=252184 RepID=A0AA39X7R8_9PEZI|nr:major facilitator superfamily domain-containing protein [Bombardia bombarda]